VLEPRILLRRYLIRSRLFERRAYGFHCNAFSVGVLLLKNDFIFNGLIFIIFLGCFSWGGEGKCLLRS